MLNYQHILLATDLSEDFNNVAATAKTLAERAGAELSVVHVIEHTPVVYGGGEFSIPLDMSLEEQLTLNVKRALETIGKRYGIPETNQHIAHGSVKKEILDLAQQLKINLIVVGTHGHSGLERLLGSVANAVLHAAKCDVLTVKVKKH